MTWSQPCSRASSPFSALPAVPMTVAPSALHHCEDGAHPARGRVHEHGLARAQPIGAAAEIPGRHPLEHRRRCGLEVDPVGDGNQLAHRHHPPLAIGAQSEAVRDSVAGLEGRSFCGCRLRSGQRPRSRRRPHRLNHARSFHPDRGRQRRHRVEPAPVVGVDEVQPDGFMPDEHLARSRVGYRHFFPTEHLGAPEPVDADGHCGVHVGLPAGFVPVSSSARPGQARRSSSRRGPYPVSS